MISRTGNEICCDKNQICALRFFWDFICVIPHSCNRIFGCLILDGDFYHLIDPQGKKKIEFCLQCYICRYFYSQMFIQAENFYSAKSFIYQMLAGYYYCWWAHYSCRQLARQSARWQKSGMKVSMVSEFFIIFVYKFETSEIFALLTKNEIRL